MGDLRSVLARDRLGNDVGGRLIPHFFPIIIIVLSGLSSLCYFLNNQNIHGLYWAAAAVLNICVLCMKEG